MTFARVVFLLAGVTGILSLTPMYFLEGWINRTYPPAITHPEQFYGFLGVTIAWQGAFLVFARDPTRFRPLVPVAVLEKLAFSLPSLVLVAQGRVSPDLAPLALCDLGLGVLFTIAFVRTPPRV